jgi:hypothetical protein
MTGIEPLFRGRPSPVAHVVNGHARRPYKLNREVTKGTSCNGSSGVNR